MKHIYVVEDHVAIRESVERYLRKSGYTVSSFGLLKSALKAINESEPDLLIQDVMIPDGDGFEFIKELRKKYNFPVIYMTARSAVNDRITGFETGGDDYIVKPFSPKELVLRIEAIFKRMNEEPFSKKSSNYWILEESRLYFDEIKHSCAIDDNEVVLTAAEWRILALLINNAGNLVHRGDILEKCFDYAFESYERIVDTHIKNIRAKLGREAPNWIETVRGYGYRFIGQKSEE